MRWTIVVEESGEGYGDVETVAGRIADFVSSPSVRTETSRYEGAGTFD
jgi:hypothetical protein